MGIIPLGGKQMNRILAVAILLGITGCSYTQSYVTNISPAGKNGILVERCKTQMNQLTTQISDSSCNTSYVWLGGEGEKNISKRVLIQTTTSSRLSSKVLKLS